MPQLLRLREAGFAIWPFDPPGPRTVVELYPRTAAARLARTAGPPSRHARHAPDAQPRTAPPHEPPSHERRPVPNALRPPTRLVKSRTASRQAFVDHHLADQDAELRDLAVSSEDAFDAAVSAVVLSRIVARPTDLPVIDDPVRRIEGEIWSPPSFLP